MKNKLIKYPMTHGSARKKRLRDRRSFLMNGCRSIIFVLDAKKLCHGTKNGKRNNERWIENIV